HFAEPEALAGVAAMALPLVLVPLTVLFAWRRWAKERAAEAKERLFGVLAPIGIFLLFGAIMLVALGIKGDFSSTFLGGLKWDSPSYTYDDDLWKQWQVALACLIVFVGFMLVTAWVAFAEWAHLGQARKVDVP